MRDSDNRIWILDAACRTGEVSPDTFFEGDIGPTSRDYRVEFMKLAKEACGSCVVRPECLETALKSKEEYGIWGGLTSSERRSITRKRAS